MRAATRRFFRPVGEKCLTLGGAGGRLAEIDPLRTKEMPAYSACLVDATIDIPPPPVPWVRVMPPPVVCLDDMLARIEAAAQRQRERHEAALDALASLWREVHLAFPSSEWTSPLRDAMNKVKEVMR
jgi:hypothetical protein